MENKLKFISNAQPFFINTMRVSIFLVMVWIGGLKAFQYEADGIVPFVANSPFMSFFYSKTAPEYTEFKNPEGKMVRKNIEWHKENNTYIFSYFLGGVIIIIGTLTLLGIWYVRIGLIGGLLTFGMSMVTLTFLITTPDVYVPNLGGDFPTPHYGFPYLSGSGRLVLKDLIMMSSSLVISSDSARRILDRHKE